MQYGFIIPNGDTQTIPELAAEAETAGWDGIFTKPRCKIPCLSTRDTRRAATKQRKILHNRNKRAIMALSYIDN